MVKWVRPPPLGGRRSDSVCRYGLERPAATTRPCNVMDARTTVKRSARRRCSATRPSSTPPAPGSAGARSSPVWRPWTGAASTAASSSPLDGRAKRLYEKDYCARGQAENLIYTRKRILASDRTSCRSPTANQLRIVLHTPAFLLLHQFRAAVPWRSLWRGRRFDTLRLGLVKVAAFIEEKRARVIVRLSEACPAQQTLAAALPRLAPQPP